ncbi:MAG: prepilin peptidase [Acidimicrobiales bacterium]
MSAVGLIGLALLGLVAGSFATMGVHRLADPDIGLWRPGPRCPGCQASIATRDLVPVVSFVTRRGRCRACGDRITWTYPLVEVLTAALFVVAGWRRPEVVELIPVLVLVWTLVVASVTDLYIYLIPNRLTFPAIGASVLVMVPLALVDDPSRLGQAAVGLALYFTLLFVPHLLYPAGMGMGDVKLSLLLGLHLGYLAPDMITTVRMVVMAMLLGSLLGVLAGAILMISRRAGFDPLPDPLAAVDTDSPSGAIDTERGAASGFPFGPPLAVGCLWVVFFPAALGLT